MKKLLIANRGEIAIRIMRSATEAGLATVAVYPDDDSGSLHVTEADQAVTLPGAGSAAYLAIDAVIAAARSVQADAIHPGYGFLSENADFARACEVAGIIFVGPAPETLEGTFPHQVKISVHGTGWRESAVNRWIDDPVAFRDEGAAR